MPKAQTQRTNESFYRELIEQSPVFVCVHDMNGVLRLVNPAAAAALGYLPSDGIGRNVRDFLSLRVRQSFDGYLERIRHVPSEEGLARLMARDGKERIWSYRSVLHEEPGCAPCVLGHARDITERWAMARARRESESRFRALADCVPAMIFVSDAIGNINFCNQSWAQFTGRTMQKELHSRWTDGIHPHDRAQTMEQYEGAIRQARSCRMEFRLRSKDGEYRWIAMQTVPRFRSGRRFEGFISCCMDETETRQDKDALRELTAGLLRAQEDERGHIARELHDDLGQKLSMLCFDLDRLSQSGLTSVGTVRQELRALRERVAALGEDVRQMAHQLHPSAIEHLGLASAIRSLAAECERREGIKTRFHQRNVPESLPAEVSGCLYRVAQEALHNVSKHASGAEVSIRLSGAPGSVRLTVRDTGPGFDPELLGGSHGLGIAGMRERARLAKGRFSLRTRPGKGVQIRVEIPLEESTHAPQAAAG